MATLMTILAVLCCAGGVVGVFIERRIRAHHPGLWQQLGFPERQALVPANQEGLVRLAAVLTITVAALMTYMVTALFA